MSLETAILLADLAQRINANLDRLHDALLRDLRFMARVTGQRTRADRVVSAGWRK